jgi:hypothetical protein
MLLQDHAKLVPCSCKFLCKILARC